MDSPPSARGCRFCGARLIRRKWLVRDVIIFGIVGIVFVWKTVAVFWGLGGERIRHPAEPPTVRYIVTGSAMEGDLTYCDESGDIEKQRATPPWHLEMHKAPGEFLYRAAQKPSDHGNVYAEIDVNGEELQWANSTTSYGIATVSGRVLR